MEKILKSHPHTYYATHIRSGGLPTLSIALSAESVIAPPFSPPTSEEQTTHPGTCIGNLHPQTHHCFSPTSQASQRPTMEFLRSPGGLDVGTSLSPTSSRSTIKPKLHRSHTALPSITTRATATRRTTHNGALDEEGTGAAGRQQEKHKSSGGSRRPHLHVRSSHSHSYKPQQHHHHRHLQKEPPLSQEQQNSSSSSRHHHNSHSHRHHGSSARDAIQSAIQLQPPTSFGDLLRTGTRSTGPSAPGSRQESRRQSLAVGMSDGLGSGNGDWRVGAGAGSGSSSGGGMLVVATKEGLERQKEKARLRQE